MPCLKFRKNGQRTLIAVPSERAHQEFSRRLMRGDPPRNQGSRQMQEIMHHIAAVSEGREPSTDPRFSERSNRTPSEHAHQMLRLDAPQRQVTTSSSDQTAGQRSDSRSLMRKDPPRNRGFKREPPVRHHYRKARGNLAIPPTIESEGSSVDMTNIQNKNTWKRDT